MAKILYRTDSNEFDITPDSLTPASSGEVSLYKEWIGSKLKKQVAQGAKIRDSKPLTRPKLKQPRLIDIKEKIKDDKCLPKCCDFSKDKPYNSRLDYRKNKPMSSKMTDEKCTTSCKRKNKQCSTRLLQLAAPTKRHCMETWRNRSDKLSPLMVERLKKYVVQEAPVVEIADALECFQRGKTITKRKTSIKGNVLSDQDRMELKKCCGVFGARIAQKLMIPIQISLKDKWQKVSDTVNVEISTIMRKYIKQNVFNRRMNMETADKITIWIAGVLEDSENVLLEEAIRDLEEEEGPVLDALDDAIDQAMIICNEKLENVNNDNTSMTSILQNNIDDNSNTFRQDLAVKSEISDESQYVEENFKIKNDAENFNQDDGESSQHIAQESILKQNNEIMQQNIGEVEEFSTKIEKLEQDMETLEKSSAEIDILELNKEGKEELNNEFDESNKDIAPLEKRSELIPESIEQPPSEDLKENSISTAKSEENPGEFYNADENPIVVLENEDAPMNE